MQLQPAKHSWLYTNIVQLTVGVERLWSCLDTSTTVQSDRDVQYCAELQFSLDDPMNLCITLGGVAVSQSMTTPDLRGICSDHFQAPADFPSRYQLHRRLDEAQNLSKCAGTDEYRCICLKLSPGRWACDLVTILTELRQLLINMRYAEIRRLRKK
jgi:hypothetical protein